MIWVFNDSCDGIAVASLRNIIVNWICDIGRLCSNHEYVILIIWKATRWHVYQFERTILITKHNQFFANLFARLLLCQIEILNWIDTIFTINLILHSDFDILVFIANLFVHTHLMLFIFDIQYFEFSIHLVATVQWIGSQKL